MKSNDWLSVDRAGLRQLLEKRGRGFAIKELIQNAWDQKVTKVEVFLQPIPNKPFALVTVVDDDPEGFKNLSDAFTLFAPSYKKTNPLQRGRFNLGEKLVLAIAEDAAISTTKGTVIFNDKGRHTTRERRLVGSVFTAHIRMTRHDIAEVERTIRSLIPPVLTYFNGEPLGMRHALTAFNATLETEVADEEGNLKRSWRQTDVRVYEVKEGEVASIYEMGIPIVETHDQWHYDVMQKVPLNMDRDNVPPSYLRTIRAHVANAMRDHIDAVSATSGWATTALESDLIEDETVKQIIRQRFGNKVVKYDPSDPEGSKIAVTQGYKVLYGGQFSAQAWSAIDQAGAVLRAGIVTPSPKAYSDDPNAPPLRLIDESEWDDSMTLFANYAQKVAKAILNRPTHVQFTNSFGWPFGATYGPGLLTLNVGRLGHAFFEEFEAFGPDVRHDALLLHEFAHEKVSDHLSDKFADEIATLGGKLKKAAVENPGLR